MADTHIKTVLVATDKPFAKKAVDGIKEIVESAGYDFALLENYGDKKNLLSAVSNVEAIIVRSDKIDNEVFEASKNLQIVVRAGAGYDNIDLKSATEHDVVVMNTPGQNSNAVAELVLGLMTYSARNFYNGKSGSELKGKSIGIVGFGNVGRRVATLAKAYDMDVYGYDAFIAPQKIKDMGFNAVYSLTELFQTCNYVSLHMPATKETIKSIDYQLLKNMPQNSVLINTARKEVIDEEGLRKMFFEREDFRYISDIAPDCADVLKEKYPERYFATPKKMGAQTAEANINAGLAAASQIVDFFKTGNKKFMLNEIK